MFEFAAPHLPEYVVEESKPPFSGPSGMPIDIRGQAFLRVRFGTANAHTDDGLSSVSNAPIMPSGYATFRQIQMIEDFEAVVIYVVGLDAARPFRVLTFSDPPRVAIDVYAG